MKYKFKEPEKTPFLENHLNMGEKNPKGEFINTTSKYLTKNSKPWIPIMGEIHFSRVNRKEWKKELAKMKAGGITLISTYVFWIHHEEIENELSFEGNLDVGAFIDECAELGLDVILRLGPWAHGECRNGGFPDWLLKKPFKLRDNNPQYLSLAKNWYKAVYEQVKGKLYKDGGNIIGIQIENELVDNAAHLAKLKELAVEVGFSVPIYTVTGWNSANGARIPEDEFIPVFGGYPEAPWTAHTRKLSPSPNYFFHPMRNDSAIGTDLIITADESQEQLPYEKYPFATCELGGGIQVTHHRRPKISPKDIFALSLVKLGSGNNLPGYYMYHGGTNPIGKLSSFNESKASGYSNDCTILSYDFQACIGERGQIRGQYNKLKMLHQFLLDFGEEFAPLDAWFSENDLSMDTASLRYCARTDGEKGFIFVNNYQRLDKMSAHRNVQFEINGKVFPEKGMDISDGDCFFIPFGMKLDDNITLDYATAQPLCRIGDTYFFVELETEKTSYSINGKLYVPEESEIINIGNIKIVTLNRNDAENLYKFDDDLYISSAAMYKTDSVHSYSFGKNDLSFRRWNGKEFENINITANKKSASITCVPADRPEFQSEHMAQLNIDKKRDIKYYSIKCDTADGFVGLDYSGDVLQVYADGELIADDFYHGDNILIPAELICNKEVYVYISEPYPSERYIEADDKWELRSAFYVPYYEL